MLYGKKWCHGWLLGFVLSAGCAGAPSMVGFAHPEPAPSDGHELTTGFGGGGGAAIDNDASGFNYYGGELSYAAKVSSLGVSFTAWGAALENDFGHIGGHLELAIPMIPGMYGSRYYLSRQYLLVGMGNTITPGNPSYRPQISVGFLRAPPASRSGAFWGARLHAGLQIHGGQDDDRGEFTGASSLTASFGYRWRAPGRHAVPSIQISPFIDYDTDFIYAGIQAVFAVGFQVG